MIREQRTLVTVNLPLPPSLNKAFASRRGSHLTMKTEAYRFWIRCVQDELGRGDILGRIGALAYGLSLHLPETMRGDIDNRVKLVSDILKVADEKGYGLGVVDDDRYMRALHVMPLAGIAPDRCQATVVLIKQWPEYISWMLQ